MKCDRRHAHVGCVHHHHAHTVDAMKTETHGTTIRLARRRMTDTLADIFASNDSELVGRNFLIVEPTGDGYADVNVIHVTADNVDIVYDVATHSDLDIYELIATEE